MIGNSWAVFHSVRVLTHLADTNIPWQARESLTSHTAEFGTCSFFVKCLCKVGEYNPHQLNSTNRGARS